MSIKRTIRPFVLAASTLAITSTATSENWIYLGPDSNGSDYSIDQDSISSEDGRIEFWSKIDASSDSTVKYREKKTLARIDCKKKRLGTIYSVIYYPNGSSESYGPFDYATLSPIVPGSMGEWMEEFVCS